METPPTHLSSRAMMESSGRQKSCQRCIAGKRRCDLQRPSCGRCSGSSWLCDYSNPGYQTPSGLESTRNRIANDKSAGRRSLWEQVAAEDDHDFQLLSYPPSDFAQPVSLPPARLKYCASELSAWIPEMVDSVRTSFIRPLSPQEHTPAVLREAYTACALHSCVTNMNAPLISGMVRETYLRLLNRGADGTLVDELVATQAVLLLHVLALFGSDIQSQSLAESQIDVVRNKVLQLQRTAAKDISGHMANHQFTEWLTMENIRRTVLASTLIESIYMNLRDGFCKTVSFLSMLPITVAGKFWRTDSEEEWRELSSTTPLTVLPYGEAVGWWREEADHGELDSLQRLLFIACKGSIDTARQ